MPLSTTWPRPLAALALAALTLALALPVTARAGEASDAFKEGRKAAARGDWDWAVVHMQRASDLKPENDEYQNLLAHAKLQASYMHFESAKRHLAAGNLREAIAELQQTVALNPSHQYAYAELEKSLNAWKRLQEQRELEAGEVTRLQREADEKLSEVPKLDPTSNVPIAFQLENVSLEDIFKVIQGVSNINVIFDEQVKLDDKTSLVTDNVTLEEALDLLMLQNDLAFKVYNDHTILVYPNNQTKQREYEDQIIRTFYLSNADVKEVQGIIRQVIDVRKVAINEKLNSITIKDTPDKVAIAGKIIDSNDKAKAEIICDLEILEVNRSKLKQWGIDITTGGEGITSTIAFDDDQLRLNEFERLRQLGSWIFSPIPSAVLRLIRTDSDTRVLTRPQVRVTDGEKVMVHMGDQVPIPNTSFNTSTTSGSNIVPVTSYTYQDTGIQVQLEPRIHNNREVTLKLRTEISTVSSVSSEGQPTIASREIETVIRLRDGETNLLAGLFAELRRESSAGVLGLQDVPLLNKVFGNHQKAGQQTEIVLTVTPHIIRVPDIGASDFAPLSVGTEKETKLKGAGAHGVGGGPFRRPDERPPEDPFTNLRPGATQLDREGIIVPDPDAALQRGELLESAAMAERAPVSPQGEAPAPSPAPPAEAPVPPAPQPAPASPSPAPAPGAARPSAAAPSGTVTLAVGAGSPQAQVGQEFTVEVRVDTAGNELANAPYHLTYDPSLAEALRVTEGEFFRSAGVNSMFLPSVQPGRIIIGHSQFGSTSAASGSGVLVRATFRALAAGSLTLGLDNVSLSDRTNDALTTRAVPLTMRLVP